MFVRVLQKGPTNIRKLSQKLTIRMDMLMKARKSIKHYRRCPIHGRYDTVVCNDRIDGKPVPACSLFLEVHDLDIRRGASTTERRHGESSKGLPEDWIV